MFPPSPRGGERRVCRGQRPFARAERGTATRRASNTRRRLARLWLAVAARAAGRARNSRYSACAEPDRLPTRRGAHPASGERREATPRACRADGGRQCRQATTPKAGSPRQRCNRGAELTSTARSDTSALARTQRGGNSGGGGRLARSGAARLISAVDGETCDAAVAPCGARLQRRRLILASSPRIRTRTSRRCASLA